MKLRACSTIQSYMELQYIYIGIFFINTENNRKSTYLVSNLYKNFLRSQTHNTEKKEKNADDQMSFKVK